ncbi:AlpA family phage regulatory protein [Marinicella sp. S1101]|uniref:helix-turn-helix transcriptional regulator n=1 Tax=Marinicella marina TaxID=2996016 RepID=UPI002260B91B|nr:AlpA family phage regulatory protein [Marinicella marina]MCX7553641.1 AlpA family phage regulatory protein [Marinicella marina]MDJ1140265.1 AlpA family phage regulatory protein [Marinicella marina]
MNQLVKYIRWNDLKEYLPFSKSTIYSMIKEGRFPAPIKLSVRVSAWSLEDVNEWLEARKQDSH